MQTPWGTANTIRETVEGVYEVTTPSHGGLMLREWRGLSEAAQQIGEHYGQYLCFEEDCAYAAVFADMPGLFRQSVRDGAIIAPKGLDADSSDDEITRHYLAIAHRWYPDAYCVACSWCAEEPHGLCYRHGGKEALHAAGHAVRTSAIGEGEGVRVTFQSPDGTSYGALVSKVAYRSRPLVVYTTPEDYGLTA